MRNGWGFNFDDNLFMKSFKEAEKAARLSKYCEEREKKESLYKEITRNINFRSIFVRKAKSRQTGERTVFYDIELIEFPQIPVIGPRHYEYRKYDKLLGHSFNLSYYANYRRSIIYNDFMRFDVIPALKYAYDKYVHENFYGKEIEYEGYQARAYQIDWFDEVYKADKKILTSFQKYIQELEDKYEDKFKHYLECTKELDAKLESWEYAHIHYVERYGIEDYTLNCINMIEHPENHPLIKNIQEYIKEAEKILHRKLCPDNILKSL